MNKREIRDSEQLATLCDLIDVLAANEERPAVVMLEEQGCNIWTYRELSDIVFALARGLAESGFGPDRTAALLADNGPQWLAAALGVIRAGGVVLPLDAQMGNENLRHVLADSGAEVVFVNREQAGRLGKLTGGKGPRPVRLDSEKGPDSWRRLLHKGEAELPGRRDGDQAALFYTSGTTGPPKGVPLSHRNIVFQLNAVQRAALVKESDRVLLPLPMHHVYPFVIGMLVPLRLGLPIILPGAMTGPQILRAIRETGATVVIGVPRLYRALLAGIVSRTEKQGRFVKLLFRVTLSFSTMLRRRFGILAGRRLLRPVHRRFGPSLRLLASGGSPLDPQLARELEGLGWQVAVGYGLTETAPLLTIKLPEKGGLDSVGLPVEGVELRIDRQAVPSGGDESQDAGEVLARGPNVFRGYRNLPEKTEKAFAGDNWLRTGDLGYLDKNGFLHLSGRVSTMIITESGEKVQPEEVEKIYSEHAAIEEIGILEKEKRLTAVIIPKLSTIHRQKTDIEAAVREAVSEQSGRLPSYQRLSDYVISRQSLPRTRLGKIRRHLLAERYRQAREETRGKGRPEKGPLPLAEMNDRDQILLDDPAAKMVWDWLAGRYPEVRLTPDTSPQLDLGIDSLEWLNLTMEISQRTGRELDEEAIGRIEKVRDLLQELAEEKNSGRTADPERPLVNPEEVLDEDQQRWLRPLNPALSLLRRFVYLLNFLLMRLFFRLRVRGREHLPRDGQYVIAPNHVSFLDPFALAAAIPLSELDKICFAGWTGIAFGNPVFRFGSRLARAVPIDDRRAVSSSLAYGAAVLKNGENLIWFPEGGRSPNGRLQELKLGLGLLLKQYPVSVIPVYIDGAHKALPPGRLLPRPAGITLFIGKPFAVRRLAGDDEKERVEKRIMAELRRRLEALGREAG